MLICVCCGCATFAPQPLLVGAPSELVETPFYPQADYLCGPSALATVLHRTGVDATPEQLADQVYVPGRRGSLQVEMIAATRRYDRLAVRIHPQPQAIVDELTAGYPVLVLQNLGVAWIPFWHYAVVVGYEPESDSFVLRSGTTERLTMSRRGFARTWARSDNWAVVMLSPGELPQTSAPEAFVEAVAGLESIGRLEAALSAYGAGLTRWPDDELLWFGYANSLYASGAPALAAQAYRDLLTISPDHLPALNNLAHVLGELGCREQALAVIAQAPEAVDEAFAGTLAETRQAIATSTPSECRLN